MKKLFSLMISLMLFLCTISVSAAKYNQFSEGYTRLGKFNEITIVYDNTGENDGLSYTHMIGNYLFVTENERFEVGILQRGENGDLTVFIPLDEAYGSLIDDWDLDVAVNIIRQKKSEGFTPLLNWQLSEGGLNPPTTAAETDPMATEPDEGTAPIAPSAETFPSAPDYTEPQETATASPTAPPQTQPPHTTAEPVATTEPVSAEVLPTYAPTYATDPTETTSPPDTHTPEATKAIPSTANSLRLNIITASVKCGKVFTLKAQNAGKKKVTYTSSNKKVVKVSKSGKVSPLRRGFAKITVKVRKTKLTCTVKVVSDPKLSKTKLTIKKGKTKKVKLSGKCSTVKNKYKNTKYAKITSKATASTIKIRALKRGKTTLKVRINGVWRKLTVKVV